METNLNFTQLYSNYVSDVFKYSMFKLRNRENAEDVTSETFLRLMNKGNLDEVQNYKAWIIGTARNVIYEKYREEKKNTNYNSTPDPENDDNLNSVDEAAMKYDLEKEVLDEKLIELIKQELDQLDDDTREVLILKIWEEMQFNEIADITKEKESTVKLRYYRGLEKLKVKLQKTPVAATKIRSFTLPLLMLGISQIGTLNEFVIKNNFYIDLGKKLGLAAAGSQAVNIAAKGIIASTTTKIAALLGLGGVIIVGTTVGVLSLAHNSNKVPLSYPTSYAQGITNTISVVADVDPSSWPIYTIKNSDRSSIDIKYPTNWKVTAMNGGATIAFIAPDGAALGYDFGDGNKVDCKNNRNIEINGSYGKFMRYFDDKSYAYTNWYVCEFNYQQNKFILNTADQFTLLSINDTNDLPILDEMIKSIHRYSVSIYNPDPGNRIVYIRESLNNQLWISNPDGSNAKSLNVQNVVYSFKRPSLNTVLYTTKIIPVSTNTKIETTGSEHKSYILDLTTNTTTEIKYPELEYTAFIGIQEFNLQSSYSFGSDFINTEYSFSFNYIDPISPDGKTVLIDRFCGYECLDAMPTDKNSPKERVTLGVFSYNIINKQEVYLEGSLNKTSGWDSSNNETYKYDSWDNSSQYIYVTKYSPLVNVNTSSINKTSDLRQGSYRINVSNGQTDNVTNSIGNYYRYIYSGSGADFYQLIFQSNIINNQHPLQLLVNKNGNKSALFTGSDYYLDRSISISPNKDQVAYFANAQLVVSRVDPNVQNNIAVFTLPSNKDFGDTITWVDNDNIVGLVKEGTYPNASANLVLLNVKNKSIKNISNTNDIQFQGQTKDSIHQYSCDFHDIWGVLCEAGLPWKPSGN